MSTLRGWGAVPKHCDVVARGTRSVKKTIDVPRCSLAYLRTCVTCVIPQSGCRLQHQSCSLVEQSSATWPKRARCPVFPALIAPRTSRTLSRAFSSVRVVSILHAFARAADLSRRVAARSFGEAGSVSSSELCRVGRKAVSGERHDFSLFANSRAFDVCKA